VGETSDSESILPLPLVMLVLHVSAKVLEAIMVG
jgi:hypothetical protein